MAAKRTSRQRAASRRNIKIAQAKRRGLRRHLTKRKIASGAAVLGVGLGAAAVWDKKTNIRLYHNTTKDTHRRIAKHGFRGSSEHGGHVFFAAGRNTARDYGGSTVTIKLKKSHFKRISRPDEFNGRMKGYDRFYRIHESDLRGVKIRNRTGW
jgi:hypothetical protein